MNAAVVRMMATSSIVALGGLPACVDATVGQASSDQTLDLYSWWTHPGEAQALDALLAVYQSKYPETMVIKAAGSDISAARAELAVRMVGGRPPDAFQASGGGDLLRWVLYNGYDDSQAKVEPLDSLAADLGLARVLPAPVLQAVSYHGKVYGIPVGVHRFNILYYNKAIFARLGLEPPDTLARFYEIGALLKAQSPPIIPLALGTNLGTEPAAVILDNILVAKAGAAFHDSYLTGRENSRDPRIVDALTEFSKMLDYINSDHDLFSWDAAAQMVIDGRAAMTMTGDWAKGLFVSKKFDVGAVAAPGTDGVFVYAVDTFCLPMGAPDREAALRFLKVGGSVEGQKAFSPIKGSTPPRTDVDLSLLDGIAQKTAADFRQDTLILGSITRVKSAEFNAELFQVIKQFSIDRKVSTVVNMLRNRYDLL